MLDRQKDFEHDEMVAADISLSYDEGSNNEAAVYGPANCEDMSSSVAIPLPAPETASTSRVTFCDNNDENDHRYVGLVNQAMTCYLNSLIQTLYMTPEFRNAIYEWKFSGTDEKKNIPFQLQKLFLLLQSSDKTSLETTDLTASFGWQSNEAYDQHDVQELCRLMFDALEHRWRNTDHKTLIQDLYKGTMQDFVKCLKCKTEKVKDDVFLDLPLAVKQFGATESFKSVEEALRAFIKPEILDGNNQYQCEKCKSKQDAEKGLRITHFPYLLTIQLKRFDFDYNTLHRIKLNDRMSFPDVLDLNGFIQTESTQTPTAPKMSYASAARKKTPPPEYSNGVMPDVPEEGILKSQASDKMWLNVARDSEEIQELLRKGPYVYELFSIMVHQGSASGGHYFAYIKNIDQNKWLTFNDTLVQSASLDDIYRTFGGPSGGWNSNTNAYMLMYRQINVQRNKHFTRTLELPEHLLELKQKWEKEEAEREQHKLWQQSLVKVHYVLNRGDQLEAEQRNKVMAGNSKLSEVLSVILDEYPGTTAENSRLICCNGNTYGFTSVITQEDMEEKTLSTISSSLVPCLTSEVYLLLDTKPDDQSNFYEAFGDTSIDLYFVDLDQDLIRPAKRLFVSKRHKMAELKELLCTLPEVDAEDCTKLRMVIDRPYEHHATITLVNNDLQQLDEVANFGRVHLYIDVGAKEVVDADRAENFPDSKMYRIFERKKFSLVLKIRLPTQAEYRQAGMVPPSELEQGIIAAAPQTASTSSANNVEMLSVAGSTSSVTPFLSFPSGFPSEPGGGAGTSSSDNLPMSSAAPSNPSSSGRNTPLETNLSDDDGMDISTFGSTPKTSPMVSDVEESHEMDPSSVYSPEQRNTSLEEVSAKLLRFQDDVTNNDVDCEGSVCETLVGGTETTSDSTASASVSYRVVVVENTQTAEGEPLVHVEVDRRQSTLQFKQWLAQYLNLESKMFNLYKHYSANDDGYLLTVYEEETDKKSPASTDYIRDAFGTIDHLKVKLSVPTNPGERLIRILQFDLEQTDKEKMSPLFDIAASEKTTVAEVLQKCRDLYATSYGTELKVEQLRLRDIFVQGATMLKPIALEQRGDMSVWHRNLYLQILSEDQIEAAEEGEPVMIRRWHPSKLEVGSVSEIYVPEGPSSSKALRQKISQKSGIPLERIGISDPQPTNTYTNWPYSKSVLDLVDMKFIKAPITPENGYGGKLIYYRDMNEFTKTISEDERKAIRIKENTANQQASTPRRRERPLRIQMSSISEDY